MARNGKARRGQSRHGMARQGEAGRGEARRGTDLNGQNSQNVLADIVRHVIRRAEKGGNMERSRKSARTKPGARKAAIPNTSKQNGTNRMMVRRG
jgi:hypothetical protein